MAGPAIDAGLMLAMAVQAPSHFDFDAPGNPFHGGNVAVTRAAVLAGPYMHHVREIDEVWHAIDPDPGDRLFIFPIGHKLFDFRRVLSNKQVTCTAVRNRGNAGNRGRWGIAMAEKTRNAIVASVFLMAEGDRLDRGSVPKIERQNVHERKDGENSDKNDEQPADKPR